MVSERDLGVRDDCRGKKGMGGFAKGTQHPLNHQWDLAKKSLEEAGIAAMPDQTGGAAAGALYAV